MQRLQGHAVYVVDRHHEHEREEQDKYSLKEMGLDICGRTCYSDGTAVKKILAMIDSNSILKDAGKDRHRATQMNIMYLSYSIT